jgi:tetratricopeptide (TPR) repeat protein
MELYNTLVLQVRKLETVNNFANYLGEWGYFQEALRLVEDALQVSEETAGAWLALLVGLKGMLYHLKGEPASAIPLFQRALKLAKHFGLEDREFNYALWLSECQGLCGDLPSARKTLEVARGKLPGYTPIHTAKLQFRK